jgi:putative ABC transport system substrate-binding protein
VLVTDPLFSGFVQSLGRPGGSVTGFSVFEGSVGGEWLALLKEAAPAISRVSLLFNPETAPFAENYRRSAEAAAPTLGITVVSAPCGNAAHIEIAFDARAREGSGGIIGIPDTFINEHRDLIIELAVRHHLPAVYGIRDFVPRGGLLAYSADFVAIFHRAAGYVDQVLRGVRPGRVAGAGTGQVYSVSQSQSRRSNRSYLATKPDCPRRRGDRVVGVLLHL